MSLRAPAGGTTRASRALAALVLVAALAFALSPLAAGSFGGFDPADFPVPQDDPPVQPAGYAFSIWGPIYLWLVAHAGFGLLRRADDPAWAAPRAPLLLSLAVGAVWIPVAEASPVWATVLIGAMLAGALAALARTTPKVDRWLLQAPVALYAGWLTAASCVSVGLLLAGWGWTSEAAAAWIALGLALALAGAVQGALGRAPEYGLAVAWAVVAVGVANWGASPGLVALAALGAVTMAALAWRAAARPA